MYSNLISSCASHISSPIVVNRRRLPCDRLNEWVTSGIKPNSHIRASESFEKILLLAAAQVGFAKALFPRYPSDSFSPPENWLGDLVVANPVKRWGALKNQTDVSASSLRFANPGNVADLVLPHKSIADWKQIGMPLVRLLLKWAPPVVVCRDENETVPVGNAFVAYMAWSLLPADEPIKVVRLSGKKGVGNSPLVLGALAGGLLSGIVRDFQRQVVQMAPSLELAVLLSSKTRSTCAEWRADSHWRGE